MNKGMQRLVKAAAAMAVAATAAVGMAGAAHATVYTSGSGAYAGSSSGMVSDGGGSGPSTQNLSNLNRDMWTVSKSVSAGVHFHSGLVSGGSTVSLSVQWGNVATTTGTYSNTYGAAFSFNFPPGDGSQRYEIVNVTMTEHTSDGRTISYIAGRSVPIQALSDVSFGPLNFTLQSDCANFGDSNFNLYFTQSGVQGEVSFGLGTNQTHSVGEFARTWREASVATDLRLGSVNYYDEDFHFTGATVGGESYPKLSTGKVLPAPSGTRTISWTQSEAYNGCSAHMSYTITTALRTYSV